MEGSCPPVSRQLHGGSEKNHEKYQSGLPVPEPRCEPGTFGLVELL